MLFAELLSLCKPLEEVYCRAACEALEPCMIVFEKSTLKVALEETNEKTHSQSRPSALL